MGALAFPLCILVCLILYVTAVVPPVVVDRQLRHA